MANFSIEWLSKSFYTTQEDHEVDNLHATTQLNNVPLQVSGDDYSPTSPNNSCGYTSSSESEPGDDSEGEAGLHRRMRTKFTSEQINKLENTFSKHKYIGATQRRKIAEKLNLSETQVKTWFQNRRMKFKRDLQDLRPQFFAAPPLPSSLLPLPPLLYSTSVQHQGQLPVYGLSGAGFSRQLHRIPFPAQQLVHQPHIHPSVAPTSFYY